jgi:hypothetical protein
VERCKGGRSNAVLMQGLGGHVLVSIEVKEQIDHLIRDNQRTSTEETSSEMSIRHGVTGSKNENSKGNVLRRI